MPTSKPSVFLTTGEIARRVKQPLWRVEYLIRSRGVTPVGRAGNARVFANQDVAFIELEVRRIDRDKEVTA